jgi:hypothetical protein
MSEVECLSCSRRFPPQNDFERHCPGCGSSGPFRIPCWRCQATFTADDLVSVTCAACKTFWTIAGPDPRYRRQWPARS